MDFNKTELMLLNLFQQSHWISTWTQGSFEKVNEKLMQANNEGQHFEQSL